MWYSGNFQKNDSRDYLVNIIDHFWINIVGNHLWPLKGMKICTYIFLWAQPASKCISTIMLYLSKVLIISHTLYPFPLWHDQPSKKLQACTISVSEWMKALSAIWSSEAHCQKQYAAFSTVMTHTFFLTNMCPIRKLQAVNSLPYLLPAKNCTCMAKCWLFKLINLTT